MKHADCYKSPACPAPGDAMSIKVLLADDSDIIRGAIGRLLKEEPKS
jgi:hypothetical protein